MNLSAFLFIAITSLAAVQAQITYINHDQVQPFPQLKPATVSDKAAIKFKPQLHISVGCHPYPAVQPNGSVSAGLAGRGAADGECTGSRLGSQVYSRSDWYKDKWAIMYAWYFPKGRFGRHQQRHMWESAIVWIDDPAKETPSILAISSTSGLNYKKQAPPKSKYLDGTSVKLDMYHGFWASRALRLTKKEGEFQDLITWEQLTVEARNALSTAEFYSGEWSYKADSREMPLHGKLFYDRLEDAWPF